MIGQIKDILSTFGKLDCTTKLDLFYQYCNSLYGILPTVHRHPAAELHNVNAHTAGYKPVMHTFNQPGCKTD
jgi:hypothetical protein